MEARILVFVSAGGVGKSTSEQGWITRPTVVSRHRLGSALDEQLDSARIKILQGNVSGGLHADREQESYFKCGDINLNSASNDILQS